MLVADFSCPSAAAQRVRVSAGSDARHGEIRAVPVVAEDGGNGSLELTCSDGEIAVQDVRVADPCVAEVASALVVAVEALLDTVRPTAAHQTGYIERNVAPRIFE